MSLPDLSVNLERTNCPKCGVELPMFRMPDGVAQALSGGWTCHVCDARLDRFGKLLDDAETE